MHAYTYINLYVHIFIPLYTHIYTRVHIYLYTHIYTYSSCFSLLGWKVGGLVAQTVKNPPAVLETWVRSPGWEDPLEKGTAPRPSILAWESHEQRSLAGYSPCGHKELDSTERLSLLLLLSPRNKDSTVTSEAKISAEGDGSLVACWCDGGLAPLVTGWQPRGACISPRLPFPSSRSLTCQTSKLTGEFGERWIYPAPKRLKNMVMQLAAPAT